MRRGSFASKPMDENRRLRTFGETAEPRLKIRVSVVRLRPWAPFILNGLDARSGLFESLSLHVSLADFQHSERPRLAFKDSHSTRSSNRVAPSTASSAGRVGFRYCWKIDEHEQPRAFIL